MQCNSPQSSTVQSRQSKRYSSWHSFWKKRPLLQQSVHTDKKKDFLWDLASSNDWTVFFELPELKAFSIKHFPQRYLPNYKTSWCFCHISKQKYLFCWPRTHCTNWRENCFLEWDKNRKCEKMIADYGSPSWRLKCIVAEVGCQVYIPPSFRKAQ